MPDSFPMVSIIIPCRNEEQYISSCLDSIIESDYPLDKIEVLVCDGNSDDSTQEIIRSYAGKYLFIRLLINEQQTTPFALNLGIKHSTGEVIIRIDAHAEIEKDYIKNCIEVLYMSPEIGCAGGRITNIFENKTAEIISHAMSSNFGVGNAHFRTGDKEGFVDTLAFGAYKKAVINQVGLFDEELTRNQDDEYNFRLIKQGFKIYLSGKIKSKYYVRGSFKKLFRQYYQYGYWKVLVNKKHRTVTTLRQIIPLLFVLFLLSAIIAFFYTPYIYFYSGILVLYVVLAFSFAFKKSKKPLVCLKIAYSFFILHLSYGLGYLEGIFNFLLMNRGADKKKAVITR